MLFSPLWHHPTPTPPPVPARWADVGMYSMPPLQCLPCTNWFCQLWAAATPSPLLAPQINVTPRVNLWRQDCWTAGDVCTCSVCHMVIVMESLGQKHEKYLITFPVNCNRTLRWLLCGKKHNRENLSRNNFVRPTETECGELPPWGHYWEIGGGGIYWGDAHGRRPDLHYHLISGENQL